MRVLLDTDILLDVALGRSKFFAHSAAVLHWAGSEPGEAAVAWHSLSNIAYLLRPDARPFIRDLLKFVEVPTTGTDAAKQAAAALVFGASYIVTRNIPHYRTSPVPAISAGDFMAKVKSD